jgi:hypothetical protein
MKKILILASAVLLAQYVTAAPLAAVMTFDSMAITADGVTKQTHFQERFIRDTHSIWSERILPKVAQHSEHEHESTPHQQNEHEHKHNLNFATAGKWLVRDASDNINFRFVRKEDKTIVVPRSSEYGTLGFDGAWETAYYLVNRAALKKMTPLQRSAPAGSAWYEQKTSEQFTRILWDSRNELALVIESGHLDGSSSNKISLAIAPTPSVLPWHKLSDFQTIAYEDLLD